MQLYAVNFIPLLNSLYTFRAAHTPVIRSTTAWHPREQVAVTTYDCTSGCRYSCTPDDGRVCRPKRVE